MERFRTEINGCFMASSRIFLQGGTVQGRHLGKLNYATPGMLCPTLYYFSYE